MKGNKAFLLAFSVLSLDVFIVKINIQLTSFIHSVIAYVPTTC